MSPVASTTSSPPAFLPLAAHPVRWRLMGELAYSDRRVSELCGLLDRPQNLISYHLGRLRTGGVVTSKRSAADGRDAYYTLELEALAKLLAQTGPALHPGLIIEPSLPDTRRWRFRNAPVDRRPTRVLFLCTGNSARSRMAEALARHLEGSVAAFSAGSHPKPLHPNAVRAMRERGIKLSGHRSRHVNEFAGQSFDYVVSLCDKVREVCPEFPGHPDMIHWSVADPSSGGATDEQTYPAYRRTATELAVRVPFLLDLIEHHATREVT